MKFNIYLILTLIVFGLISCSGNNEEIHSSPNLQNETSQIVSSNAFTIEGKITNGAGKKIYLFEYGANVPVKIDSNVANEMGKYNLQGQGVGFKFYSIGNTVNNVAALLLKGGEKISLNSDFNQMSISAKAIVGNTPVNATFSAPKPPAEVISDSVIVQLSGTLVVPTVTYPVSFIVSLSIIFYS